MSKLAQGTTTFPTFEALLDNYLKILLSPDFKKYNFF